MWIHNNFVSLQSRIGGISTPTDKGNPTTLPTFANCWNNLIVGKLCRRN